MEDLTRGQIQSIALPPKLNNKNTFRNHETSDIRLNAYGLQLDNVIPEVYQHEIKFLGITNKGVEKDISRRPKNDICKQQGRKLLYSLFMQLIESHPEVFGDRNQQKNYIYDCGCIFYSTNNIFAADTPTEFELSKDLLPNDVKTFMGRNIQTIKCNIMPTEIVDLKHLKEQSDVKNQAALQFLEILSSQDLTKGDKYHIFAGKMFLKDSRINLDNDPRVLKEGMQKNVRLIGNSAATSKVIVQIDTKKTIFNPEIQVVQYLERLLKGNEPLESKLNNQRNFREAVTALKGVCVVTTHLQFNRQFEVFGLTEQSCRDLKVEEKTLANYFYDKHRIRLNRPDLPCAVEKQPRKEGGTRFSHHPLELLKIIDGQRVSNSKCDNIKDQIVRKCQTRPVDFKRLIEDQMNGAFMRNGNPFFKAHGVGVDTDLITQKAEVLYPPALVYSDREEPDLKTAGWRLTPNRRFVKPVEVNRMAVVLIQNEVPAASVENFVKRLKNQAQLRGILIDQLRFDCFEDIAVEYVDSRFDDYSKKGVRIIIFFSRSKTDSIHGIFKMMEVKHKIVTQHILGSVVEKGLKGSNLIFDNLLMKFNEKLGGINHNLTTSTPFSRANSRFAPDIGSKEWFNPSRIFFGLDLSHAAAQSLYERQTDTPVSEPTVIGMSFTGGTPGRSFGNYWYQQARCAYIKNLKPYIVNALKRYYTLNNVYPKQVFVYRGGVSEGEYRIIIAYEEEAFKQAFQEIYEMNPNMKIPQLVIVVVQRQSNYRIAPINPDPRAKPPEQNVRPGTCIDANIMNPNLTEFLLVASKAIQGTARPIRCTVITDTTNGKISLEELEYITYHLCFMHGIVTSPVSVPAVLYAAGNLSKRGRNNQKTNNDFAIKPTMDPATGPMEDEEIDRYFVELSDQLQPTIDSKFWS